MSDKDLLIETLQIQVADRDREIEVLTQERDNALLRVEELLSERDAETEVLLDRIDQLKYDRNHPYGGVHPNA